MKDKNFIGKYGLFSTIVVAIMGVFIFSYPKDMAVLVGTDGWIVTIISGLIAFLVLYIIYKSISINDFNPFTNILENNLGNILGRFIGVIFVIYNIILISIGMRIFAEVLKMFLLEKTPTEFIIICLILTGTYLIRGELTNLIRFNEIIMLVMIIPILIVIPFALEKADVTNILPILTNEPIDYIKAIGVSLMAFNGLHIAYLVIPYIRNKNDVTKILGKSIMFISIFYIIVTIVSLFVFSVDQTKILLWPTISMIKSIDISGAFVERWEGLVMVFWIMFYFTTFINYYYFSADIVKEIFNLGEIKFSTIIITPLIYILSLYPQNIAEVYDFQSRLIPVFSVIVLLIIPLLLILTSRRKRG